VGYLPYLGPSALISKNLKTIGGPMQPSAHNSNPRRTNKQGSTTPRSGADRPQGDPKGEARSAE
jgi:hypothetical protein